MVKIDALALVVGIGLVSFLMFYFAAQLEKEHGLLKFLTIMFALALLIVVPAAVVNNEDCDLYLTQHNRSYKFGDNYSGYHWDYQSPEITCNPSNPIDCVKVFHEYDSYYYTEMCVSDDTATQTTFFKLVMWFYRLFILYIIIYLGYQSLMAFTTSYKDRGRK